MKILITLLLSIVIPLFTKGQVKKPCSSTIHRIADDLPELIPPIKQIADELRAQIKLPDSLLDRSGTMFIEYVVNCEGEAVRFKELQLAESDGTLIINYFKFLSPTIAAVLRDQLKYKPARKVGKTIDFIKVFAIRFTSGEMQIWGID